MSNIKEIVKGYKEELKKVYKTNVSIKDIELVIKARLECKGDYSKVRQTRLYINHSCQYCSLLELIEWDIVRTKKLKEVVEHGY